MQRMRKQTIVGRVEGVGVALKYREAWEGPRGCLRRVQKSRSALWHTSQATGPPAGVSRGDRLASVVCHLLLLTPSVIHPFSVRSLVRVVVCLKVADRRMQGYCNIASCRMRINPPNLQMHTGPHVIWSACQR